MDVSLDTSQVGRLAADLGRVPGRIVPEAAKVVLKGAMKVRDGMRKDFTGHSHAPHIPRAVDFDIRGLSAEIGVNKAGPQGGLGNILAYGTSKNAPVVDHTAALQREAPDFARYLAEAGQKALL